jgi:hypothetical protein
MVRVQKIRNACRVFALAALWTLAMDLLSESLTSQAFTTPLTTDSTRVLGQKQLQLDTWQFQAEHRNSLPFVDGNSRVKKQTKTARSAVTVMTRVIHAMGAGAVASVIQAALSAVGEPIVNRVLVRRMRVMDAVRDVSPMMMLRFFKTTLTTNFLKFPLFEAINTFLGCFALPASIRGFITGVVFTSVTLPVTNFRYRKSMDLPVEWGNIYEAYAPTVIRDIVYGIARNYMTIGMIHLYPHLDIHTPQLLFVVVIGACLVSAPFNEWRGYLLQSKGKELTFNEFFNFSNCIRSTSLGAIKQGLALSVGYWCAPPATHFVRGLIASFKGV